ncbi:hypothetical protein [Agrobacterium sp. SORGH_AS 787]|uniref:hypothetical protein n=1 Tax=Agrobacterium sp. SORGH_AS 787 TaxID=3041775 RepID=UPI00277F5497|nr:hypothetical protein [Rhizobium sp. SORGH_AS_0787]
MGAAAPFDKTGKAASAGFADDLSFRSQHAGPFEQKLLLIRDEDRSVTKSAEHRRFADGMHPSPSIREKETNSRATFWPLPCPTSDRNIDTSDDAPAWIVGKSDAGYDTESQNITTALQRHVAKKSPRVRRRISGGPHLSAFFCSQTG